MWLKKLWLWLMSDSTVYYKFDAAYYCCCTTAASRNFSKPGPPIPSSPVQSCSFRAIFFIWPKKWQKFGTSDEAGAEAEVPLELALPLLSSSPSPPPFPEHFSTTAIAKCGTLWGRFSNMTSEMIHRKSDKVTDFAAWVGHGRDDVSCWQLHKRDMHPKRMVAQAVVSFSDAVAFCKFCFFSQLTHVVACCWVSQCNTFLSPAVVCSFDSLWSSEVSSAIIEFWSPPGSAAFNFLACTFTISCNIGRTSGDSNQTQNWSVLTGYNLVVWPDLYLICDCVCSMSVSISMAWTSNVNDADVNPLKM